MIQHNVTVHDGVRGVFFTNSAAPENPIIASAEEARRQRRMGPVSRELVLVGVAGILAVVIVAVWMKKAR